ncbi:MAG: hypothetical protein MJE77_03750, partial [Proteobacteria bacterium]|nr:hypothetical protein [Pseudomonadota bacterium]
ALYLCARASAAYALRLSARQARRQPRATTPPSNFLLKPPSIFVLTLNEYGGGWREVCIHARMSQDIRGTGEVSRFTCNLGVGVPILLHTGRHIPLHEAQSQSATAANAAAYATLTNTVGVSARMCQKRAE